MGPQEILYSPRYLSLCICNVLCHIWGWAFFCLFVLVFLFCFFHCLGAALFHWALVRLLLQVIGLTDALIRLDCGEVAQEQHRK